MSTTITVCVSCRAAGAERDDAPGKALFQAVREAAAGLEAVTVRPTQCLSVCKRVCTVALSGEGRYTFLFGDLDPSGDAGAIVAMAEACARAPYGFVPWKDRPESLRKGTLARIPPLDWSPADGSAPA